MPRIGIGLGLGLYGGSIDAQAQAHYNRVIADGGVVPAGVSGTNAFFNAVKSIYGTSDITTAISVGVDAHYLGYKLGAGAGATSGQAVQKLYSCAGSSGDVVQTTAASQPLLLAHSGASSSNYWYGSGVTGNYCSTPNAAANQITGDIEIIVKANWSGSGNGAFVGKWQGSNLQFTIFTNGVSLFFYYSQNGTSNSNIEQTYLGQGTFGLDYWYKITSESATGATKFYKSADGITFTQVGSTQNRTTGALFNGTSSLTIGSNGTGDTFTGKIYRATIANSIGGTPVVDFNPATYNASTSQTQWTSTTGEVWTINTGTATTGYKGVLVDRTIVQSDGVDDKVLTTGITLSNNHTNYCAYKALVQDGSGNRIIYNNGTTNFVNAIASVSTNILFISLTNSIFGTGGTKVFQTLGLSTSVFGTNNTKSKVNNGTFSTPLIGTYVGGAGISLFGAVTVHFANHSINTMIVSVSDDSATINTAMYNYIRSINNNAF